MFSFMAEFKLAGAGQFFRVDFERMVLAFLQFGDAPRIDVKAQHRALFAEFDCQWQAYVAKSDYSEFHIFQLQLESPRLCAQRTN